IKRRQPAVMRRVAVLRRPGLGLRRRLLQQAASIEYALADIESINPIEYLERPGALNDALPEIPVRTFPMHDAADESTARHQRLVGQSVLRARRRVVDAGSVVGADEPAAIAGRKGH